MTKQTTHDTLLEIKNLRVIYQTPTADVYAINNLSLSIKRGEWLGFVGESGSGKSTTAFALLHLLAPTAHVEGKAYLDGTEIITQSEDDMRAIRGRQIAFIPQEAMNALNPVLRIRAQMADMIREHEGRRPRQEVRVRIAKSLEDVGLSATIADRYPHELSGGMKQRVCIALATLLNPLLIIADEPTSALDVVTQQLVAQTLVDVQQKIGASVILIGHDMGLQAQLVDRLAIMYAGHIVELADVDELFANPLHPYAQLLIQFIPSITEKRPPSGLPGLPPRLLAPPVGCVFRDRCPAVFDRCHHDVPSLREIRPGHWAACHLHDEGV